MASTYPRDDISIAATDAPTPAGLTDPAPVSTMMPTPAIPSTAPMTGSTNGRSDSTRQAISIITTDEVAMITDAVLVGSSCAAR